MRSCKFTISLLFALFVAVAANAQTWISAVCPDNTPSGDASTSLSATVYVQSLVVGGFNAIAKRSQTLATGHETFMCFGAGCYAPSTDVTPPVMIPGVSVDSTFKLTCNPAGNTGVTTAYMTFLIDGGVADSSEVMIVFTFTSTVGNDVEVLDRSQVSLANPFPNPANDEATIVYTLGTEKNGTVNLYNGIGQVVRTATASASSDQVTFDTNGLESGIYFVELSTNAGSRATKKLVVK